MEDCGLKKGKCPLAGNSVHEDKKFIYKDMPNLYAFLHYRIVDVTSIKELVYRWLPEDYYPPKKKLGHRALDDVRESIKELKYYQSFMFTGTKAY